MTPRTRRILTIGVLTILTAGVAIALKWLFSTEEGAEWVDAVSGASTLALLAVTVTYALQTNQLVRAQERTVAVAMENESNKPARRVQEQLAAMQISLFPAESAFPLAEDQPPTFPTIDLSAVDAHSLFLRSMSGQLLGASSMQAISAANCLADVSLNVSGMTQWIEAGKVTADAASRPLEWADVRHAFYEDGDAREALGAGWDHLPEWSDVASGNVVTKASQELTKLEMHLFTLLQRLPPVAP
jgi:hypothetical protein